MIAIAAVVLLLVAGAVLAFNDNSDSGSSPQPPTQADRSPARQAEDFAAWLRENSQP